MAAKRNAELLTLPEKTACKEAVQYVDRIPFSVKFLAFRRQFLAQLASWAAKMNVTNQKLSVCVCVNQGGTNRDRHT